jgi:hypothetical protein
MNLINVATKKLEYFIDERTTPPYAILSHTWIAEETTQQEFRAAGNQPWNSPQARQLSSYSKINGSCEQALQDGITYVWIDACCIDRTSSNDLTRSINSMFRWYRQAKVCYAYLSDVFVDTQSPPRHGNVFNIAEKEIAKSKWFTRGWTLQELIAPPHLKFFSATWIPLGEKSDMLPLLESISGVHTDALNGTPLGRFSIATRMAWASSRVTSVLEDVAYCLLGIFDVNMPLIYGEGEKAFLRLQEEIMKDSEDQSLFAWGPPPSTIDGNAGFRRNRTSIFAQHPVQYANSSSIRASCLTDYPDEPYRLTNIGVQIELPLVHVNRGSLPRPVPDILEVRAVVLSCLYTDSENRICPGIVVGREVGSTSRQWTRIAGIDLIRFDRNDVKDAKRSMIYLAKKAID